MWLMLFALAALGISIGIAQNAPACRTDITCDCCKSKPDGSSDPEDICNDKASGWECTYGCKDGYYGAKCWIYCPGFCTQCAREFGSKYFESDYQICYICADGFYNGTGITNCSTPCPTKCAQNKCDKTTGKCLLGCVSSNWTGDKCDVCADTWYGNNCDIRCPDICTERICARNGDCYTCADDNLVGPRCDRCKGGKYGENCDMDCPVNCKDKTCERVNGICTNGCEGNFAGDRCDNCKANYYGEICNIQCYNCLNGICDRSTGRCIDCVNGKFGEQCDKSCSTGCNNTVCDRSTAVCSQGCSPGYTGDKCCVYNNGCEICDTTISCSKCKSGFYGNLCSTTCLTDCAGACDKETGNCEACKEEKFYGDKCNTSCSTTCLNGQCAQEDGRCTSCKVGYFGSLCKDICSENCLDGECGRGNGLCTSCKAGYYDEKCTETCPSNCEDNMCGQNDGVCNSCIAGFHGDVCDSVCKRQDCINNTCSQSTGFCALGCINGCEEEPPPSSPVGPAVGGAIGGFAIIALVVVVIWFVLRRRKQRETVKKYSTDLPKSPITSHDVEQKGVYENCDSLLSHDNTSQPIVVVAPSHSPNVHDVAEVTTEPEVEVEGAGEVDDEYYTFKNLIKVADLQAYVKQNAGEYFSTEFQRLAKGLIQPCTFATKSENIALNRFNGIYPYDHSRVKLPHDKKFFINACYIKGNQQQKAYIASLGPTKVTTDNFATFWKMVWYEKSDIIVMLTNLQEPSGMKCQKYWPDLGQSLTFRDLEIKCDSEEKFTEYTLRTFTITKGKERRTVSQLHFTAWPDKSVPNNVTSLIEFRQRVKSTYTLSQGPVIVHCSAGIGRTGTYIAIDLLTEEGMNYGHVDVFGCIRNMRDQRVNMVQTPDQYEYVYRAIVYSLTFDVDYTPTETFNEYVMSLTDSQYAAMHKKLGISIESKNKEHEDAVAANKKETTKNRPGSDVPGNENRPRLYLNRNFNDPNYINAVYIDGYKRKNKFIMAQTPLSSTVDDFACLIFQENCTCIISIENADNQKQDVGCYIPEEKESLTFGSFVVTCLKYQNKYNHQYRQLKIANKGQQSSGERIVNHYQYTNWKNNERVPSSDADFVQFIKDTQSSLQNDDSPLLVHCLTGGKKCGLFCTVSLLLERADIIRQISVANTVRMLRLRRPNVIPNKEQLKFAHQCVASQMEMLSTYTNFSM